MYKINSLQDHEACIDYTGVSVVCEKVRMAQNRPTNARIQDYYYTSNPISLPREHIISEIGTFNDHKSLDAQNQRRPRSPSSTDNDEKIVNPKKTLLPAGQKSKYEMKEAGISSFNSAQRPLNGCIGAHLPCAVKGLLYKTICINVV